MTARERFWQKVDRRGPDECWPWMAGLNRGYGQFAVTQAHRVYAHRFSYEELVGPIPDGLTLDHLCRNRSCVNPAHLDPVTAAVNSLRGYGAPAQCARQTHCKNGHEFTPENTYRPPSGGRECRVCKGNLRRNWRAWRASQGLPAS